MELRHLRYFVAIAEERSFTRAAERLWIAQPGLSTQIRRLETELGVRLLDRHTRGVDLTEAGELFLQRARAALLAADAARATGRDFDDGVVGSLKLGVSTAAHWRRTPALIERFTRLHDGVELNVLEGYGGTLWRDLRDGRLDAMIVPAGDGSGDLRSLALTAEPWMVLVGTCHRLVGDGPLDATNLDGERLAISAHRDGSGYDRVVAGMLSELGVRPAPVRSGPGLALQYAVAGGDLLALTTAPDLLHTELIARPLKPARTLPFKLLWHDETPSPALSELVHCAKTCLERKPTSRPILAAVA